MLIITVVKMSKKSKNEYKKSYTSVIILCCISLLFCFCDSNNTLPHENPGETENPAVFTRDTIVNRYIEYRNGNFPLVISVPHGGSESNSSYTLRTKENCPDPQFSTVKDLYTIEFANLMDSIMHSLTGKLKFPT